MLDYDLFAATPLAHEPFDHMVVPGFLPHDDAAAAAASFGGPDLPGVLPAPGRVKDDAFGHLLNEIRSQRFTDAFAEKYGLKLSRDTLMVTLRARTRPQDGQIHTDTATKVITALIYLNTDWSNDGGRLRVLRSKSLDDMAAEVPPIAGTLMTFRVAANSWHGHHPYDGPRKAVMINWMVDAASARRELFKHQVSAGVKALFA